MSKLEAKLKNIQSNENVREDAKKQLKDKIKNIKSKDIWTKRV